MVGWGAWSGRLLQPRICRSIAAMSSQKTPPRRASPAPTATTPHLNLIASGAHTATSALEIRDHRILLTQDFREAGFYDSSAVAIAVVGREATADFANEQTVRLLAAPGKGKFTVLIASAAS